MLEHHFRRNDFTHQGTMQFSDEQEQSIQNCAVNKIQKTWTCYKFYKLVTYSIPRISRCCFLLGLVFFVVIVVVVVVVGGGNSGGSGGMGGGGCGGGGGGVFHCDSVICLLACILQAHIHQRIFKW